MRSWSKCAICGKSLKNKDKNKTKACAAQRGNKGVADTKRQAKRRDEWTLLPQIYWPGPAKVQHGPPGLQFRPLPPSNPVISREDKVNPPLRDVFCALKHNELRNISGLKDKVINWWVAFTGWSKQNEKGYDVFEWNPDEQHWTLWYFS